MIDQTDLGSDRSSRYSVTGDQLGSIHLIRVVKPSFPLSLRGCIKLACGSMALSSIPNCSPASRQISSGCWN